MKASYLKAFGGPENLVYGDLPDPKPGKGQALVRVRACALNHLDLWVREGNPAYTIGLPHVLGNDIAGELLALGPDTELPGVALGSPVSVAPGVSCWTCAPCRSGRDNLCESYGILGANGGWGGYAELAVVPARGVFPMPRALSFAEAASVPLTFLTAYHMLKSLARVQAGETVLVLGAGSGVGVAAVQVAKALGARVLAASSAREKLAQAKALGADEILLSNSRLSQSVKKLTAGRGADVVFEHIGGELFQSALRALAAGGRLVTCGATAGSETAIDLRFVFFKELSILGAKMGPLAELGEVFKLFENGALKPVVSRTFPLTEAREAQEFLAGRKQFGKVVLIV